MLILAAVCMSAAANAKILRVSNFSGSSAPYSTIEAAHDAASAGDGSRGDCRVEAYTPSGMMLATANWPKGQNELSLSVSQAPKGSVVMVKVTDRERGMQVLRRIIMKTHL